MADNPLQWPEEQDAPELENVEMTVAVKQFYKINTGTNIEVKRVNSRMLSKPSSARVESEQLQYDLS
jgi:hypothetical protein